MKMFDIDFKVYNEKDEQRIELKTNVIIIIIYMTFSPKHGKHTAVDKGSVANTMIYLGDDSGTTMRTAHVNRQLFKNDWLWQYHRLLCNDC